MDFIAEALMYFQCLKEATITSEEAGIAALQETLQALAAKPGQRVIAVKSNNAACGHYSSGQLRMQDNEYSKALVSYTNAIQDAEPYSLPAAMSYVGRSRALMELKYYEEALTDISYALELPIPPEKEKDCTLLKQVIEAKLKGEKSEEQTNQNKKLSETVIDPPNIQLTYGESDQIPGVSSAIKLDYDADDHRKLVATRDIKAGDVLMILRPYMVFSRLKAEKAVKTSSSNYVNDAEIKEAGWICEYCLKKSVAPIPCDLCYQLYCSKKCRTDAYIQYHAVECQILETTLRSQAVLRFLLILTKQGTDLKIVKKHLEKGRQKKASANTRLTENPFHPDTVENVLSLNGNTFHSMNMDRIFSASSMAMNLRNHTHFFEEDNNVLEFAKFIYCIQQIYCINAKTIGQRESKYILAEGLYPVFCMMNHSCLSNTLSYSHKTIYRVVRAAQDIKTGDQIYTNHLGPEIVYMSARERKINLINSAQVNCACDACARDYTFSMEIRKKIHVPASIRRRLKKNLIDITAMWEVLHIIYKEIKRPCIEIQLMQIALARAYMGLETPQLWQLYNGLGAI